MRPRVVVGSTGCAVRTIACALVLALGCSCARRVPAVAAEPQDVRARVSLERPTSPTDSARGEWAETVFPARYSQPLLPVFPPEAIEAGVASASVRVDFLIGTDGLAREVRASLVQPVARGELFLLACDGLLDRWKFSPAWRLPRPGESVAGPVVPLPSRAHLLFHFDLAGTDAPGRVQVSFGPTS
jgi:hypothetical protein